MRLVCQVVVVAAETVGSTARVQRIRHAQQLLNTLQNVVGSTSRVGFSLEEVRTVCPVDGGKIAVQHGTATHLQRHQAVNIGNGGVCFLINYGTVRTALQDGDTNPHIATNERVALVANHRLIGELLRGLGEGRREHAEKQR